MKYRLQQSGSDMVVLRIKIDVALLKDTLFSDINAADRLHTHGGSLLDLKRVNFDATKRHFVSKNDEDFKPHQAEVYGKNICSIKIYCQYMIYIENRKRKIERIKKNIQMPTSSDITSEFKNEVC